MNARSIAFITLFAAVIGVLGLLPKFSLPIAGGVPITAQTLGVMLAGVILGPVRGFLACALFLFVVALGMPMLAGGRGGLGVFFGPSAGFLLAWPIGALVSGLVIKRLTNIRTIIAVPLASAIGGIGIIYLIGVPVLAQIADLSILAAATGSIVFIPGDMIKVALATVVYRTIERFQPDALLSR